MKSRIGGGSWIERSISWRPFCNLNTITDCGIYSVHFHILRQFISSFVEFHSWTHQVVVCGSVLGVSVICMAIRNGLVVPRMSCGIIYTTIKSTCGLNIGRLHLVSFLNYYYSDFPLDSDPIHCLLLRVQANHNQCWFIRFALYFWWLNNMKAAAAAVRAAKPIVAILFQIANWE